MEWPRVEVGDRPKTVTDRNAFINPYNFIRTPARPKEGSPLGDREPFPRDTYQGQAAGGQTYSGVIPITITARTPLILPDQAAAKPHTGDNEKGSPRVVSTRRRFDDQTPLLLGSSVKGMLRSAYEAITNSRFGIFNEGTRNKPGSLRRNPDKALDLLPGWVDSGEEETAVVKVRRFDYHGFNGNNILKVPLLHKSVGERFINTIKPGIAPSEIAEELDKMEVFAWLQLREHHSGRFRFWDVAALSLRENGFDPSASQGRTYSGRDGEIAPIKVKGIIHWTDSDFMRGGQHKHYERFIPKERVGTAKVAEFDENAFAREEIARYRASHPLATIDQIKSHVKEEIRLRTLVQGELASRQANGPVDIVPVQVSSVGAYLKWEAVLDAYEAASHQPGANTNRPGKYVTHRKAWSFTKGRSLFVDLSDADDAGICRIDQITPALIGRDTYEATPWDLLDQCPQPEPISEQLSPAESVSTWHKDCHHPAPTIEHLSPADRVFGWVAQKKLPGAKNTGWKGLLTVDPPEFFSGGVFSFGKTGLELGTLGEPKVSQARFYSASRDFKPEGVGSKKSPGLGFTHASRLRGRKVYLPHVQYLGLEDYWNQSGSSDKPPAYRRWNETKPKVDTNLLDAVSINSQFKTALRFQQLTAHELGALVWLLSLPWEEADAQAGAEPEKAVLSLGLGKPYGFGSVSVEPDWEATRIDTADDERDRYCAFGDMGPETASVVNTCFEAFDQVLDDAVREDFLDAVCGYSTGKDQGPLVHYPMTADQYAAWRHQKDHHEKGLFLWWVENDRGGANAPRESLPTLGGKPPTLTRHPEQQRRQPGRRRG